MTGLYLIKTAWQKIKAQLKEIKATKMLGKAITLHLWTLWMSHRHYLEHVMKRSTAIFRSVWQKWKNVENSLLSKPQLHEWHLGCSFLLRLVFVSSRYVTTVGDFCFKAPITPFPLRMKNRQWWNDEMHVQPCVCANLPSLQTGLISAVSWSCSIHPGTHCAH